MPITLVSSASTDFQPAMVMIDKSATELKAVRAVFVSTYVPLCEFHVIQALRRMATDENDQKVSMKGFGDCIGGLIDGFRFVARSENGHELKERIEDFLCRVIPLEVEKCVKKSGEEKRMMILKLKNYFNVNWFCSRWIECWVDCGYPEGLNREKGNTNNPVETAFKVFDTVILGCVKNRRIDHLILVIITHVFPYYSQVSNCLCRHFFFLVSFIGC